MAGAGLLPGSLLPLALLPRPLAIRTAAEIHRTLAGWLMRT
jgi:hypothetical protein